MDKGGKKMKLKRISIRLENYKYQRLMSILEEQDISVSEKIRNLIDEFIREEMVSCHN